MALTPEWTRRIDSWRREIRTHCYRPLGRVELAGFVTADWLGPELAKTIVDAWLKSEFEGGGSTRKVELIVEYEKKFLRK